MAIFNNEFKDKENKILSKDEVKRHVCYIQPMMSQNHRTQFDLRHRCFMMSAALF